VLSFLEDMTVEKTKEFKPKQTQARGGHQTAIPSSIPTSSISTAFAWSTPQGTDGSFLFFSFRKSI